MYAFGINSMVHCGSAFEPGASGLRYYCTPPVCIPDVIRGVAVWRHNNKKKLARFRSPNRRVAGSGVQDSKSMKPRLRNANLLITHVLDSCVRLLAVLHISSAQGRSVV